MPESTRPMRPPLVLIINDQEWSTRSLESILAPNGYAVFRAYTGRKGIDRARTAHPDMIVVDANLPDMDGLELCRALRAEPGVSAMTPVIMTTSGHPTRQQRLEALRAGAWEYLGHPLDAEELLYKFNAWTAAKVEADAALEAGLLDKVTGLYNLQGLARRAHELGSQAFRRNGALACLVLGPDIHGDEAEDGATDAVLQVVAELADVLRTTSRASDAVGRVGESEFAVFALDADEAGAARLADRIAEAAQQHEGPTLNLRSGYHAVPDFRAAGIEPVDLLRRATSALRQSTRSGNGFGHGVQPLTPHYGDA